MLNIAAGFERPTAGRCLFRGQEVLAPEPTRGVVFQEHALFPWLTAAGNITFGPQAARVPKEKYEADLANLIRAVGLEGFEHSYPSELSGGMRQRVSIARALINDPQLLLMDEPFGALDAQTRSVMQELVLGIWQRSRRTVIFVTHDVEEAALLADRVIVLSPHPGRIKAEVEVPLGRPRTAETVLTNEFVAVKRAISGLVRQEDASTSRQETPMSGSSERLVG